MTTAADIATYMLQQGNDDQRRILQRFFQTGPGQYAEGDQFIGLKVPQTRQVVEHVWRQLPLTEVPLLLASPWHEIRLCGLLVLVAQFQAQARQRLHHDDEAISARDRILNLYLQHAEQANNWDLVDLSVHKIVGHWLLLPSALGDRDFKLSTIDDLARSSNLWRQRMSMVCTWKTTQAGDPWWALRYAEMHLQHPHHLMHKAVGWMLREVGKRVDMDLLRQFLYQHGAQMPRTALRYAIEKMPASERQYWLAVTSPKHHPS